TGSTVRYSNQLNCGCLAAKTCGNFLGYGARFRSRLYYGTSSHFLATFRCPNSFLGSVFQVINFVGQVKVFFRGHDRLVAHQLHDGRQRDVVHDCVGSIGVTAAVKLDIVAKSGVAPQPAHSLTQRPIGPGPAERIQQYVLRGLRTLTSYEVQQLSYHRVDHDSPGPLRDVVGLVLPQDDDLFVPANVGLAHELQLSWPCPRAPQKNEEAAKFWSRMAKESAILGIGPIATFRSLGKTESLKRVHRDQTQLGGQVEGRLERGVPSLPGPIVVRAILIDPREQIERPTVDASPRPHGGIEQIVQTAALPLGFDAPALFGIVRAKPRENLADSRVLRTERFWRRGCGIGHKGPQSRSRHDVFPLSHHAAGKRPVLAAPAPSAQALF